MTARSDVREPTDIECLCGGQMVRYTRDNIVVLVKCPRCQRLPIDLLGLT